MRHVTKLSVEIGPRPQGSPTNRQAAAYIENVFRDAGLDVEYQRFDLRLESFGWWAPRPENAILVLTKDYEDLEFVLLERVVSSSEGVYCFT